MVNGKEVKFVISRWFLRWTILWTKTKRYEWKALIREAGEYLDVGADEIEKWICSEALGFLRHPPNFLPARRTQNGHFLSAHGVPACAVGSRQTRHFRKTLFSLDLRCQGDTLRAGQSHAEACRAKACLACSLAKSHPTRNKRVCVCVFCCFFPFQVLSYMKLVSVALK